MCGSSGECRKHSGEERKGRPTSSISLALAGNKGNRHCCSDFALVCLMKGLSCVGYWKQSHLDFGEKRTI